jgi:hypothetical protein
LKGALARLQGGLAQAESAQQISPSNHGMTQIAVSAEEFAFTHKIAN